ncbi:MAG: YncE family protein [Acidobacteriota bacterium]|nr:YncE family protein [Acidobacteriota bacterium]
MNHSLALRFSRSFAVLLLALALATAWILAAMPAAASVPAADEAAQPPAEKEAQPPAEKEGVQIQFQMERLEAGSGPLQEGDQVRVRFHITDTASEAPLSGLYPAAWMDRVPTSVSYEQESCDQKVSAFLSGTLFSQPELNLNVYYVLALNDDATITIVDPLFGFGTTKLLALVELEARGEDWVMQPRGRYLYVSMPTAGKIAVVDTEVWKVAATLDPGFAPTRLALTEDGGQLWATDDGQGESSGIAVFDTQSRELQARIATGAGPHDLVLDPREQYAYVSNRAAGTVSVIDARALAKVADVATGPSPSYLAYSTAGDAAYVVDPRTGIVSVIAPGQGVVSRMEGRPGLGHLSFAPGGRYGFLVNPLTDQLHILDAARQRIIQTGTMEEGPHQVNFTDELAYIRHLDNELILMVPLDEIGREGAPISVVDFPGGQRPPGLGAALLPAPSIVQAPGAPAVLVANPTDKIIYFYKEGMAAPMGSFQNYNRQPLAVRVVDRSLREQAPGSYETTVQLRRPGTYDVAFFLDAPKLVHCFQLTVAPDPNRERERQAAMPKVRLESLLDNRQIAVGEPVDLRFRLTSRADGSLIEGVDDLHTLTFLGPGLWQKRQTVEHQGAGIYGFSFTPPRPGLYYVFLGSASLGISLKESRYILLEARESSPSSDRAGTSAEAQTASLP